MSALGSIGASGSNKCSPAALICIAEAALTLLNTLVSSSGVMLEASFTNSNKAFLGKPLMLVTLPFSNKAFSSVAPKTCPAFALGIMAMTSPLAPAAKFLDISSKAPLLMRFPVSRSISPYKNSFAVMSLERKSGLLGSGLSSPPSPKIEVKALLSVSFVAPTFPFQPKNSKVLVLLRILRLFLSCNCSITSPVYLGLSGFKVSIEPL